MFKPGNIKYIWNHKRIKRIFPRIHGNFSQLIRFRPATMLLFSHTKFLQVIVHFKQFLVYFSHFWVNPKCVTSFKIWAAVRKHFKFPYPLWFVSKPLQFLNLKYSTNDSQTNIWGGRCKKLTLFFRHMQHSCFFGLFNCQLELKFLNLMFVFFFSVKIAVLSWATAKLH